MKRLMVVVVSILLGIAIPNVLSAQQSNDLIIETPEQVAQRVADEWRLSLPKFLVCQHAYYGNKPQLSSPLSCLMEKRPYVSISLQDSIVLNLSVVTEGESELGRWTDRPRISSLLFWGFAPERVYVERVDERYVVCARTNEVLIGADEAACLIQSSKPALNLNKTVIVRFSTTNCDLDLFLNCGQRARDLVEAEIQLVGLSIYPF